MRFNVVLRHSFKNMKSGTAVELGDLHRNATVTRDFAMYVGFWEGFKTNIREVCVMRAVSYTHLRAHET